MRMRLLIQLCPCQPRAKREVKFIGLLGLLLAAGLAGCGRQEAKIPEPPAPQVEGEQVVFQTNAPQLSAFAVQTVGPRTLAVTHATGRLYWNAEVTAPVFTPVAGRVTALRAGLGQIVSAGTPL